MKKQKIKYFHHPESSCVGTFINRDELDDCCEEITEEEYIELLIHYSECVEPDCSTFCEGCDYSLYLQGLL